MTGHFRQASFDYDVTLFYSEDETDEDEQAITDIVKVIKKICEDTGLIIYDPNTDALLGQTVFRSRVQESLKSKLTIAFLSKTVMNNDADNFFRQVLHFCNISNGQSEKFAVIYIGAVEPPLELSLYNSLHLEDDRSNMDEIISKLEKFLNQVRSSEKIISQDEAEGCCRSRADQYSVSAKPPSVLGEGDSSLEEDFANQSARATLTRHPSPKPSLPRPPECIVRPFCPQPGTSAETRKFDRSKRSMCLPRERSTMREMLLRQPSSYVSQLSSEDSDLMEDGPPSTFGARGDVTTREATPDGRGPPLPRDEEETEVKGLVRPHQPIQEPNVLPEGREKVSLWVSVKGFFFSFDG